MKFKNHFTVSAIFSLIIFFIYKNYTFAFSFLISAIFIDIDHCYDYVRETGDIFVTLKKMENYFYAYTYRKAVILLHSYELIIALFVINYFILNTILLYGIISGIILHLILDIIFNPVYPKAYSFIYRLNHSFVKEKILKL